MLPVVNVKGYTMTLYSDQIASRSKDSPPSHRKQKTKNKTPNNHNAEKVRETILKG